MTKLAKEGDVVEGGSMTRLATEPYVDAHIPTPPIDTYTIATLPDPATNSGKIIFVSDAASGDQFAVSDGTHWTHVVPGSRDWFGVDPAFWRDDFSTNDISSYGSPSGVAISGGTIQPTGTLSLQQIPAISSPTADAIVVSAKFHLGANAAYNGVTKWIDATHCIVGYHDPDTDNLKIGVLDGGGFTALSSGGAAITAVDNWLVLVVDPAGNVAHVYRFDNDPEINGAVTSQLKNVAVDSVLTDGMGHPGLMFSGNTPSYYADNLVAWHLGDQPFTLP